MPVFDDLDTLSELDKCQFGYSSGNSCMLITYWINNCLDKIRSTGG